jgi:hypothetical protein
VVVVASLHLAPGTHDVDVRGSRPAVILSAGEVLIEVPIDADGSSELPGAGGGLGGSPGMRGEGRSPGEPGIGLGGGGGGGNEGDGAPGGCDGGGDGGLSVADCGAIAFFGGSGGGGGGGAGGRGGHGGGAIWIFSQLSIEIAAAGSIDVDGAEGQAPLDAAAAGGGGGGGSGGTIVLEAPTVINYGNIDAEGHPGGPGSAGGGVAGGLGGDDASPDEGAEAGECANEAGGGGGSSMGMVVVRTDPERFLEDSIEPAPPTSCIATELSRACE